MSTAACPTRSGTRTPRRRRRGSRSHARTAWATASGGSATRTRGFGTRRPTPAEKDLSDFSALEGGEVRNIFGRGLGGLGGFELFLGAVGPLACGFRGALGFFERLRRPVALALRG